MHAFFIPKILVILMKNSNRWIVDIVVVVGITATTLFTMELATRNTITDDVRETLLTMLAVLMVFTIKIFAHLSENR
jgi:hypothetical protein